MEYKQPTTASSREVFMDVLRGIAILGIFLANLNYLSLNFGNNSGPFQHAWDDAVHFLKKVFLEGKFYTIFSLLFGWGFALQYQKLQDNGLKSSAMLMRRLWGMLLFGLMHLVLLWLGDIVAFYAILAIVGLYPVRNVAPKKLFIAGILLLLFPIVHYIAMKYIPALRFPYEWMFDNADAVAQNLGFERGGSPVERSHSWWQIWKFNTVGFFLRFGDLYFVSRFAKVLGMFYIGYALGKNYYYLQVLNNKKLLKKIALFGFLIGLPINIAMAYFMENGDQYESFHINGVYQTIAYSFGVAPLAMAYVAVLALLWQRSSCQSILKILQPVGKMAFTNYMMQSFCCILIFTGVGLGYGQQLGALYQLAFGISFFIAQIIFSHTWLRFFQFGPVEWVWRCITYGKLVPMIRK